MVTFLDTVVRAKLATNPVSPERGPVLRPKPSAGALTAAEYQELGVARITYGPWTQRYALTALEELAESLYGSGVVPATTKPLN